MVIMGIIKSQIHQMTKRLRFSHAHIEPLRLQWCLLSRLTPFQHCIMAIFSNMVPPNRLEFDQGLAMWPVFGLGARLPVHPLKRIFPYLVPLVYEAKQERSSGKTDVRPALVRSEVMGNRQASAWADSSSRCGGAVLDGKNAGTTQSCADEFRAVQAGNRSRGVFLSLQLTYL